jgi:hypothetical protein
MQKKDRLKKKGESRTVQMEKRKNLKGGVSLCCARSVLQDKSPKSGIVQIVNVSFDAQSIFVSLQVREEELLTIDLPPGKIILHFTFPGI